ncbi:hypothetical protein BUALT_Bualt19G0079900 [Buddleja alternifolia]|uniref:NAC domain-containing protein n=1 Tax=Buddleja alternifolia TaxID=168488 RepID=A0AAV6W7Y8_9LAMI|nr:hypothetical protein BUALT_Bualt19G0079900 [Buddleja alternifolia]
MSQVMVPEGFRFVPTEEELIRSYLLKKAMGLPLPSNHILERDLYGEKASPWDVLSDISGAYWDTHIPVNMNNHDDKKEIKKVKKSIYVFTRLKRVNEGSRNMARIAGCGTWKGQTVPRKIRKGSSGEEIGVMKMFTFIANNKGLIKDHWIMHEYSLSGVSLSCDLKNKDYVICKITREFFEEKKKISCQPIPAPCLLDPTTTNNIIEDDHLDISTNNDFDIDFDIDELLSTLQENDQQEGQPISPCLDHLVRYSDNNQLMLQEENTELGIKKRSFEKEYDEILSCNKKQKKKKILTESSSSFEELGNNKNKSYIDGTADHIVRCTWEDLGSIAHPVEEISHNNDFNICVDDYFEYGDGDGYFCDFHQLEDGDGNMPHFDGFLMPKQSRDDENPIILD